MSTIEPLPSPSRRRLFKYSLGGLIGAGLFGGGLWLLQEEVAPLVAGQPSGLGEAVDDLIAGMEGVSQVGQWAVDEYPALNRPLGDLVTLLRQRLRLGADEQPTAADFTQRLQQAVREDFASDKVMLVNGWQLSHTEAALAVIRLRMTGLPQDQPQNADPSEAHIAAITKWGPQETTVGQPANEQSGGYSALWFDVEDAPRWAQLAISGVRLQTFHRGKLLVAHIEGQLQDKLLAEPGEHRVTLHDDMANTWQQVGVFKVLPAPVEKLTGDLCPVTNWGPRETTVGVPANPQPGNKSGLWIDTACSPKRVQVRFGDQLLPGHFNGHAVTTLIDLEYLQNPGQVELALVNAETGDELVFGEFVIKP
ncbi:MAG: hypothetical protein Tsb002_08410 [Wenzhouxiangellaceae bacterium]